MKKSLAVLALFAAPVAFGGTTRTTTTETRTSTIQHSQSPNAQSENFEVNSNDRFDNLDPRTNSRSTPAYVGAENSVLGADVTEEASDTSTVSETSPSPVAPVEEDSSLSGTSTTSESWEDSEMNSEMEMEDDSRLSGSGTTSDTVTTGTTGAATTGAAAGTAASDTSKAKKETKKAKKMNKASKTETTGAGTTAVGTPTAAGTTGTGSTGTTTTKESSEEIESRTDASSEINTPDETYDRNDQLSGGATSGKTMNTGSDLTAQDTARNAKETELVRKIRAEITDMKDLSIRAQNVKIINQNGQIHLKGPVANATEQTKVEQIAKKMAGNKAVINETYVEAR